MEQLITAIPSSAAMPHQLAKLVLGATAGFLVSKAVETAYTKVVDRNDENDATDPA